MERENIMHDERSFYQGIGIDKKEGLRGGGRCRIIGDAVIPEGCIGDGRGNNSLPLG
jgi:hypothetical protein